MKNFLDKVVRGSDTEASTICQKAFLRNFQDAVNVEWYRKDDSFEAIFYKDNQEYIASFSLNGDLNNYKHNLPVGHLPEIIRRRSEQVGEVMNTVFRNNGNAVEYELIVNDREGKRHIIIFSEMGELMNQRLI